jgi:hypothetical protein
MGRAISGLVDPMPANSVSVIEVWMGNGVAGGGVSRVRVERIGLAREMAERREAM